MSDYLWDKKGDADAEVARLEALLGAFKHEPRPLELPAETEMLKPPTAGVLPFVSRLRASRLFAPAAFAAAAALVVASVLVASLFMRARVATRDEQATARPTRDARGEERPAPPETKRAMLEPPPPAEVKVKDDKVAVQSLPRRRKDVQLTAAQGRRLKSATVETLTEGAGTRDGLTLEAMSTRDGASTLVENARLLTKEQLVYALRLTGAKLRDVRERAQGTMKDER
ncbi:MAG TPA: hypothetical protein VF297_18605 [Pyrinomonadaceae bacterium]